MLPDCPFAHLAYKLAQLIAGGMGASLLDQCVNRLLEIFVPELPEFSLMQDSVMIISRLISFPAFIGVKGAEMFSIPSFINLI
jgi:hypothetical protein